VQLRWPQKKNMVMDGSSVLGGDFFPIHVRCSNSENKLGLGPKMMPEYIFVSLRRAGFKDRGYT
jgi:hypothetical protein